MQKFGASLALLMLNWPIAERNEKRHAKELFLFIPSNISKTVRVDPLLRLLLYYA